MTSIRNRIYRELRFGNSVSIEKILKRIFPKIWIEVMEDMTDDARAEYERECEVVDKARDREEWESFLHDDADRNCRLAGF